MRNVENELQATIRVHAGPGILLRSAVGPLEDSHGMHSYTKELMVTPFIPSFEERMIWSWVCDHAYAQDRLSCTRTK